MCGAELANDVPDDGYGTDPDEGGGKREAADDPFADRADGDGRAFRVAVVGAADRAMFHSRDSSGRLVAFR